MLPNSLIAGNRNKLVVVLSECHIVDSLSVLGLVLEYLCLIISRPAGDGLVRGCSNEMSIIVSWRE